MSLAISATISISLGKDQGGRCFSRANLEKIEYKPGMTPKELTLVTNTPMRTAAQMPDVASLQTDLMQTKLDWVGMQSIELPILVVDRTGNGMRVPATASAFVSLDQPEARGIHMSRLFKCTQDVLSQNQMSGLLLEKLLQDFLESHQGLSLSAKVAVDFHALVLRKALKSDNSGWRTYPVKVWGEVIHGQGRYGMEVVVTYSSTCPASAALARQLIQENFKNAFRGQTELDFKQVHDWLGTSQGINATPHAQRSYAKVKVEMNLAGSTFGFEDLIDLLEDALQTPVQTVVKREDEQEFALRNGQNLMFCEDAARRLKAALLLVAEVRAFQGEVRHVESLHPHDAVSIFSSRNG
jgi:GTP cyclohydrolase I